jgi:hypothetical protein
MFVTDYVLVFLFLFGLETFVFTKLGLSPETISVWFGAQVAFCSLGNFRKNSDVQPDTPHHPWEYPLGVAIAMIFLTGGVYVFRWMRHEAMPYYQIGYAAIIIAIGWLCGYACVAANPDPWIFWSGRPSKFAQWARRMNHSR